MTDIALMTEAEAARVAAPAEEAGLGCLRTERGNLPLDRLDIHADITGLTSRVELTQDFVNGFDVPLEATYVFPMPDRAAVTGMRMTADGRTVEAELKERATARADYDRAVAAGQRASIAEEERPDVFTMRVGNILPGERVSVALTLVSPLSYEDGAATFRFPLVVAPRYIPGTPLPGDQVGAGYASDTDAVPDASRITPPVLLPGFPNPVRLSITVDLDPAGLELTEARSSLHAVSNDHAVSNGKGRISIHPGERVNRDFVLRLRYGGTEQDSTLVLVPDGEEGTFQLTVLPPLDATPPRPRDVVLVLDRSGSMQGWKMVAARRAAARIVDTLTAGDRFAVLSFDDRIEHPDGLPAGLVEATDRHRYRAVEHLARVDARGGTELLAPLREALSLLHAGQGRTLVQASESRDRDRVLVLVTDGQVGNEDHILSQLTRELRAVRVHTVGIDQAVNAGFLGRLAGIGGGRCELVENEDRLDEAMAAIHRRIGAPVVTGIELVPELVPDGLVPLDDTIAPARIPDLFPGVPLVVAGRYRGTGGGLTLRGTTRDGQSWSAPVPGERREAPAVTAQWARAHLRDLEDRYTADPGGASDALEKRIVDTSLRFGVLCRFTAYVAVDSRVVAEGGQPHQVVQPVEAPAGWDMFATAPAAPPMVAASMMMPPPAPAGPGMPRPAPMMAPMPQQAAPPMAAPPMAKAKAGRWAPRLRHPEPKPEPKEEAAPVVPTELDAAREQASEEARRLREAAGGSAYERRDLLVDLASRLRALVVHLSQRGVAEAEYAPLRELADLVDSGGELDALWTRAIEILDGFAGQHPSPQQPSPRRGPFWKRS